MTAFVPYHASIRVLQANCFFLCRVTERRVVLALGDFIQFGIPSGIARIDHLFVHTQDRDSTRRIFIDITRVMGTQEDQRDVALDVPILRLEDDNVSQYNFIGLPAVQSKKLYIIPVTDNGKILELGGRDLLYVDWTVEFL